MTYSQVSAGGSHTVLMRSDGCPVACGYNPDGRCNIPALHEVAYSCEPLCFGAVRVIQLSGHTAGDEQMSLTCTSMNGEKLCTVKLSAKSLVASAQSRIVKEIAFT